MRVLGTVVLLCALVAAGSSRVVADENVGSIYGRVYVEHTRKPACFTTVKMLSNREPNQETRTRPDGSFLFLAVLPGYVTVEVPHAQAQRVEVHANLESDAMFYVRHNNSRRSCAKYSRARSFGGFRR